jgi:hypothetical protein
VNCRTGAGVDPQPAGDRWSPPTWGGDQRSRPGRGRATRPQPLVVGSPATRGRQPRVGGLGPGGNQRSLAGCGSMPVPVGQFPFFLKLFFLPALHFCASGQLLLVGYSTCPPCPYFYLKLQTPITFDP